MSPVQKKKRKSNEHNNNKVKLELTSSCYFLTLLYLQCFHTLLCIQSRHKKIYTSWHNNTGYAIREPRWPVRPPQWFMAGLCIPLISYSGHAVTVRTLIDIHEPSPERRETPRHTVKTLNMYLYCRIFVTIQSWKDFPEFSQCLNWVRWWTSRERPQHLKVSLTRTGAA